MADLWEERFKLIRGFAWFALVGLLFAAIAFGASGNFRLFTGILAGLLVIPVLVYTYVVILWHWKSRYKGRHSDLWGALLILETSGWMKLVYFFRHLLQDMIQAGRYRDLSPSLQVGEPSPLASTQSEPAKQ